MFKAPLLLATATAAVLAFQAPASAAPAVTVTPKAGLTNGQTIVVKGKGYKPKTLLAVLVCNGGAGRAACDTTNVKVVTTDAKGLFSTPFKVKKGKIGNKVVTKSALLVITTPDGKTYNDKVKLTFK